ncbi:MAG: hypothetical protein R3A52_27520 [Polyangiales bacterium]
MLREVEALAPRDGRARGRQTLPGSARRPAPTGPHQWDAWGHRVDQIEVPALEARRRHRRRGLIAIPCERRPGALWRVPVRALVYLFNAPRRCVPPAPLAMTDGAARTSSPAAASSLTDRALPRLTSRDPSFAWDLGAVDDRAHGRLRRELSKETVAREVDGG